MPTKSANPTIEAIKELKGRILDTMFAKGMPHTPHEYELMEGLVGSVIDSAISLTLKACKDELEQARGFDPVGLYLDAKRRLDDLSQQLSGK